MVVASPSSLASREDGSSRAEVYVWNPSPPGRGWQEAEPRPSRYQLSGAGVINRRRLLVLAMFTITFVGLAFS